MLVTRARPVKPKIATAGKANGMNGNLRANRSSTGSTCSNHSSKSNTVNPLSSNVPSSNSNSHSDSNHHSIAISTDEMMKEQEKNQEVSSTKLENFYRFRPSFHLIAPKNWMNDPCGPCFDENTGLYHVLYQYNPKGSTWGNMSWLHATSKDLIHWEHVTKIPSLQPKVTHDCEGVFSGSMVTQGPKGEKGMLTIFYTAVSALPIHWTKQYQWGCEKLAMATSTDNGKSWKREENSSILINSPPDEFEGEIISWRDPFISEWQEMDSHLGFPKNKYLYGLISGGLRDQTPTAFLYRIEKADLTRWTFISTIADVGLDFKLPKSEIGMGRNWEVCNFFTLPNSKEQQEKSSQFLLMNVEGAGQDFKSRHPMWAQCSLLPSSSKSRLDPFKNGILDHGCLYAATTFYHTPTKRRLLWGWITEDDLAEHRFEQQGWSGCISLPREIFTCSFKQVDPIMLQQSQIQSMFDYDEQSVQTGKGIDLTTLACSPAKEVLALRIGAKHVSIPQPNSHSPAFYLPSRNCEVSFDVIFDHGKLTDKEVGVLICHDERGEKGVKISYQNQSIHISRKGTTTDPDVKTDEIIVPLTLLRFIDGSMENLNVQVFLDNSVLEIFINQRICITSRVYCQDDQANQANQISLINLDQEGFHYENLNVWTGLQKAMLDEIDGVIPMEGNEMDLDVNQETDSVAHL